MPEWQSCGDISEARARAAEEAQQKQYSQPNPISTPVIQPDAPKEK